MAVLLLTEGDTRPSHVQLVANKRAIPLAGVVTVTLEMRPARGLAGAPLRRECDVVDDDRGEVAIPWQADDLVAGLHLAKFEVVAGDGTVFHVPGGDDWLDVQVGSHVAP